MMYDQTTVSFIRDPFSSLVPTGEFIRWRRVVSFGWKRKGLAAKLPKCADIFGLVLLVQRRNRDI